MFLLKSKLHSAKGADGVEKFTKQGEGMKLPTRVSAKDGTELYPKPGRIELTRRADVVLKKLTKDERLEVYHKYARKYEMDSFDSWELADIYEFTKEAGKIIESRNTEQVLENK